MKNREGESVQTEAMDRANKEGMDFDGVTWKKKKKKKRTVKLLQARVPAECWRSSLGRDRKWGRVRKMEQCVLYSSSPAAPGHLGDSPLNYTQTSAAPLVARQG